MLVFYLILHFATFIYVSHSSLYSLISHLQQMKVRMTNLNNHSARFFFSRYIYLFSSLSGPLVPNSQKQWLSSLTPTIAPLTASSNIPWLVSMAETCQGIILSRWWILSTANCLNKLKHLDSDISGVIDQEDILLGHKICLHPSFDPQVGMDPGKGDIGVVLLQYPIRGQKIPLYHTYNIFWKSCYNCQYRHCRVYQYQNHNNFGTSIKKLSVKLLDLSFCHHQHIHLTKINNLCIWSQPQEDCWVLTV
uniref:serine protease 55-like n=1 Tax=Halichoerus grypus TaxID=9711 RepID=UPI0016596FDE|nr:serine protease 55-like [Halichoerus grypus]